MDVEDFEHRFGLKACCITGVNVAKGVARFIGMDAEDIKGANGMPDTNLGAKRKAAIKALKKYDLVFLHINGTDILSHDRNRSGKANMIENTIGIAVIIFCCSGSMPTIGVSRWVANMNAAFSKGSTK